MENYLMSSPAPLNPPFDYNDVSDLEFGFTMPGQNNDVNDNNSNNNNSNNSNNSFHGNARINSAIHNNTGDNNHSHTHNHNHNNGHDDDFEVVGVNQGLNYSQFQLSRNVPLTGDNYYSRPLHQPNLSISSVNQDPPMSVGYGNHSHSHSNSISNFLINDQFHGEGDGEGDGDGEGESLDYDSKLPDVNIDQANDHTQSPGLRSQSPGLRSSVVPSSSGHTLGTYRNSMDSLPPLSNSVSSQSFDSPLKINQGINITSGPNSTNNHLVTPRKMNRNKSLSIGSYNLTTPISHSPGANALNNGHFSTQLSGNSNGNNNNNKIIKTPYSAKSNASHSHRRSLSRSKVEKYSNSMNLNPFVTPNSFASPNYDNLSFDHDDFHNSGDGITPLQAPSTNLNQFSVPQYTSPQNNMTSSNSVPTLRRQNTLESIKIEDQDDDAFKQLKRAKSSNNIQLLQSQFNSLKSYPASVNLASFTNDSGLLPPMASFSPHDHKNPPLSAPGSSSSSVAVSDSTSISASTSFSAPASATGSFSSDTSNQTLGGTTFKSVGRKPKKSIEPEFVADLPIKVNEKAANDNDPKKKHACPLCFTKFQRPEHVKRHMKSHSSEKPFVCEEPNCNKRFNRKDNLKAHLKKIHHKTFV